MTDSLSFVGVLNFMTCDLVALDTTGTDDSDLGEITFNGKTRTLY